jgi:CHAT domain-containing protein
VASVLKALDGSSYAHIAAHGSFRSDNPLLSSLQMTDGPLTVYDLEALAVAPDVVVLSACESGLSAVRAGDEIMGLAAAFLRLGTRSLVASVVPVADDVARDTMLAFHAARQQGAPPSAALVTARWSLAPHRQMAAASFVCFGGG